MSTVNGFQVGSETLKYNYESLDNYNTPNFSTSSSTTYAVGDYVMYNGKLYKCTTATTGGTWVGDNWTEAVLSDDVSGLSRQLNDETTGLDTKAPVIINTASGAIASFDDGADSMPIKKLVAQIEPVQSGTGGPSPDNVRPISEWTGCVLRNSNGNYITATPLRRISNAFVDATTGLIGNSNYFDLYVYPIPKSTLWLVKTGTNERYDGLSNNPNLVKGDSCEQPFYTRWNTHNEFTNNYDYIYIQGPREASGVPPISVSSYRPDSVLALGEVKNLTINWQTEAGTIYGGTVTLNEDGSADLVINMYKFTADGSSYKCDINGYNSDTGLYYYRIKPLPQAAQAPYVFDCSSMFKSTRGIPENNAFYTNAANNCIYCWRSENITVGQFNNELADSPVEFCIKSATNRTYHFSNIGQLNTFLGVNNVWCDTGDTEVTYPADTKLFLTARDEEITGNIAPIENGTTASKAYAQGAYFWHDTKFCKALSAIASGATFTLDTNYQETTVAAELLAAQN